MVFARVLRAAFCASLFCISARAAAEHPFVLHPEHARYLLGEPVYVRMDASQGRPPALEEGTVFLTIRSPDGREHAYRPPLRLRTRPSVEAPSGITRSRYARLIAEGGAWVFPHPGRYVLRLRAAWDGSEPGIAGGAATQAVSREAEALSDTVSVEIAAPTAAEDKRAFDLISKAAGEYALAVYLEGGDQLWTGMEIIRGLAAFPSAYARVASFVLCSDWSQDFQARSGGEARPLDLGKALAFARWDKSAGAYVALRTAFRMRSAIDIRSRRDPGDPDLPRARARLRAFEDSLTADERALLDSF